MPIFNIEGGFFINSCQKAFFAHDEGLIMRISNLLNKLMRFPLILIFYIMPPTLLHLKRKPVFTKRHLLLTVILICICAPSSTVYSETFYITKAEEASETSWSNIYLQYPAYRIDDQIEKVSIVGSGPYSQFIEDYITQFMNELGKIDFIEPERLDSVWGGKIINYSTGIDANTSQALSETMKLDHLIFYETDLSPDSGYKYGGSLTGTVRIKIIDIRSGEIRFQGTSNASLFIKDPRLYGFSQRGPLGDFEKLRVIQFSSVGVVSKLRYAFGSFILGLIGTSDDLIIYEESLTKSSPISKTGIILKDTIVSINGTKVKNHKELKSYLVNSNIQQGDSIDLLILRNRQEIPIKIEIPKYKFKEKDKIEIGAMLNMIRF